MAQRQGIVLGPITQTSRLPISSTPSVTTGYVTPIPPYNTGYSQDATNLATNIAASTLIYGYQSLALKRLYECAASHYHRYNDYYQVPTYGGAYGNLGYNDNNGGAGDRNTYYEAKSTDYPRYGILTNWKGIVFWSYYTLTYPLSVPITNFSAGLVIYQSDYNKMVTATVELKTHSHIIKDRTSA